MERCPPSTVRVPLTPNGERIYQILANGLSPLPGEPRELEARLRGVAAKMDASGVTLGDPEPPPKVTG